MATKISVLPSGYTPDEDCLVMVLKDITYILPSGREYSRNGYIAFRMYCYSEKIVRQSNGDINLPSGESFWFCIYDEDTEKWETENEMAPIYESQYYTLVNPTILWTSRDIFNEDGTKYREGSEFNPIYIHTLNPVAILIGFQLGTAIRRMRGIIQPEPPTDITDAVLTDGILYIKNATAVLSDGILEVK